MEEPGSSSGPSKKSVEKRQKFMLHVLSPSADVPNKITFPDVPVSATVGELKTKICNAVDSRPPPERQRLIYRGRPLLRDTATLKDIFTEETIERSEHLSLHLVLPPSVPSQPSTFSAPSSSGQPGVIQQPSQWVPTATNRQGDVSQNTTTSNAGAQDETPPAPAYIPNGPPPGHLPGPLPTHLQQAMADHFQALVQQIGQQLPVVGSTIVAGSSSTPPPNHPQHMVPDSNQDESVQQPNFEPLSFNRIIARQQQARAAAGLHGLGNSHHQDTRPNSPPMLPFSIPNDIPASPGSVGSNRIVRENYGPNGQHWRMVIETRRAGSPSNHDLHSSQAPRSTLSPSDLSSQDVLTAPSEGAGNPSIPSAQPDRLPAGGLSSGQSQRSLVEENLSAIESALASSSALHESVFETLRAQLQTLQNDEETSPETLINLGRRLQMSTALADQLRARLDSALARVVGEHASTRPPPIVNAAANSNLHNNLYLLSSPSGPQALLVSPSGLYGTPWQIPTLANPPANQTPNQFPHPTASTQPSSLPHEHGSQQVHASSSRNEQTPQQQQAPSTQIQQQQEQAQQAQPQQQQQVNQIQNLARALLPMGGHIWLLVRLFGFVYFFTGGGGHVRATILGLCALLVFVAQSGLFRPFLQSIWEPFRRHVENILPLAGNDRPPAGQGANTGNGQQGRAAPGTGVPTPHQAAERLLGERDRRDGGIIRLYLRRLERALALFVASLVPGVGERHIAARDAAEAARREEERLREENTRREEEERLREQNTLREAESSREENNRGEKESLLKENSRREEAEGGDGVEDRPSLAVPLAG